MCLVSLIDKVNWPLLIKGECISVQTQVNIFHYLILPVITVLSFTNLARLISPYQWRTCSWFVLHYLYCLTGISVVWGGWSGSSVSSHCVSLWHGLLRRFRPRLAAVHGQLAWAQEGQDVDRGAAALVWQTHREAAAVQEGTELQGIDSSLRAEWHHLAVSTLRLPRHSRQRRTSTLTLFELTHELKRWL